MEQTSNCCADPGSYTFAGIDSDPSVGYVGEAYYRCLCGNTIGEHDMGVVFEEYNEPMAIGMATALDATYAALEKEIA